jgi:hypothetical protein
MNNIKITFAPEHAGFPPRFIDAIRANRMDGFYEPLFLVVRQQDLEQFSNNDNDNYIKVNSYDSNHIIDFYLCRYECKLYVVLFIECVDGSYANFTFNYSEDQIIELVRAPGGGIINLQGELKTCGPFANLFENRPSIFKNDSIVQGGVCDFKFNSLTDIDNDIPDLFIDAINGKVSCISIPLPQCLLITKFDLEWLYSDKNGYVFVKAPGAEMIGRLLSPITWYLYRNNDKLYFVSQNYANDEYQFYSSETSKEKVIEILRLPGGGVVNSSNRIQTYDDICERPNLTDEDDYLYDPDILYMWGDRDGSIHYPPPIMSYI